MTNRAIAVRFYENKRLGKTYGKGMYHKAVFNATADVQLPKAKYLLDMYDYNDWINTAKTDADMEALGVAEDFIAGNASSQLSIAVHSLWRLTFALSNSSKTKKNLDWSKSLLDAHD
mgnify:CR=1 FL=1